MSISNSRMHSQKDYILELLDQSGEAYREARLDLEWARLEVRTAETIHAALAKQRESMVLSPLLGQDSD